MNYVHYNDYMNRVQKGDVMPKIIKDLKSMILNKSIELFSKKGYKNVDMRMIAKDMGIAVGTLYNHFPNKYELFLEVLQKSWENSLDQLNRITKLDKDLKEKIYDYYDYLYSSIENRKGLGKELIIEELSINSNNSKDKTVDKILTIFDYLYKDLHNLITEYYLKHDLKYDEQMIKRAIKSSITLIWHLIVSFPDSKEENIRFIMQHLIKIGE